MSNTIITPDYRETKIYPLVAIREIVVFPNNIGPLFIGRPKSIKALEKALASDRRVFIATQKNAKVEDPKQEELYPIGCVGTILQIMRLPDGTLKVILEAQKRAEIVSSDIDTGGFSVDVKSVSLTTEFDLELAPLLKLVKEELKSFLKRSPRKIDTSNIPDTMEAAGNLADQIAPLLSISVEKKQDLLSLSNPKESLELVYTYMLQEVTNQEVEHKLKDRIQGQIGRTQKEHYLNEQMKAIQQELGEEDDQAEFREYEEKIKASKMSEEAREVAEKELKKLKMMPSNSADANMVRNYLDWLTVLPWEANTKDNYDLENAEAILNEDHYGLEKVKERIVEFLAVANRVGKLKGPIICLVGPPGVGKTSLARSVSRALGRKFVRMSLGGVRDEAEIRGHRRTYLGALPGKLLQTMKKAKTLNPLLLLDEVDKMSHSVMGDPSSALLEVLDPEQNNTFMDHYLEVEYDLSQVLFFCTANSLDGIPLPLRDRMEIINLSGYTELEKEKIASKYLLPKQLKENGLNESEIELPQESLFEIIRRYTREAGVRSLEREIGKLCRKIVTEQVKQQKEESIIVDTEKIHGYLGVPRFRHGDMSEKNEIGTTTGLAWTSVGGELLNIEVSNMKGKGSIQLTGKLGDVMKESAQAALSYVRSKANSYGIYSKLFKDLDIHVHVPEGATPKDGPSAGVALTTSLISSLTGIPVRREVAMTGEITLRGKVLPIGGLKEKLLAAKRAHIEHVFIPAENEKDLAEIPKDITDGIKIQPVSTVQEVIEGALERIPHAVHDSDLGTSETKKGKKEIPLKIVPNEQSELFHNNI